MQTQYSLSGEENTGWLEKMEQYPRKSQHLKKIQAQTYPEIILIMKYIKYNCSYYSYLF